MPKPRANYTTTAQIKAMADALRASPCPQYHVDDRGHTRSDDGLPELSDQELCKRLSEWHCMKEQIRGLKHQIKSAEAVAAENLSAYKKRMQPRFEDADRFVALALAFVTQDERFAMLVKNASIRPETVDDMRRAIDCARGTASV